MFLHIGNGKSVKEEEIIGIFDLDTATVSKITKAYVSENQKSGKVEYGDYDLPRSFIVTENKKEERIILSRISSVGLKMRIDGEYGEGKG